jgi:hypothetical protein
MCHGDLAQSPVSIVGTSQCVGLCNVRDLVESDWQLGNLK